MARHVSKKEMAEAEAQAFYRQTTCVFCWPNHDKESMVFQGRVIYFCPEIASFTRYRDLGYGYWRRKGEQTQN